MFVASEPARPLQASEASSALVGEWRRPHAPARGLLGEPKGSVLSAHRAALQRRRGREQLARDPV